MINYAELPDWINQGLWTKALTASGLNGTYFLEFDDDGDIISSRCLDPLGAWIPTSKFRASFKRRQQFHNYKQKISDVGVEGLQPKSRLKSNIQDAITHSLSGIQWDISDHEYLWHYEPGSIYTLSENLEVTIYHLNDEISKSKGKNAWKKSPSKENCVIFSVGAEGFPVPDWNPKATMPIEVLFG